MTTTAFKSLRLLRSKAGRKSTLSRNPSSHTFRNKQNGAPTMSTTTADTLAAVLAEALAETGRSIDDLTAAEAIELADGLRAFVAAMPTSSAFDVRLAAALRHAADLIEQHAGTG
jgi:hypothetical protein